MSKNELVRFSFDVLGKRLIDCPITQIETHFEATHGMPKYMNKITHFPTLVYKMADYFQNVM